MGRNSVSRCLLSLTTIIFLFLDSTYAQTDQCGPNKECCQKGQAGGYSEINNPRRSILSEWKSGQNAICDRSLVWGWYRFTSYVGGKMPEAKVDSKRCGTNHPIWMKGSHPTVNEGTVDRTACVNFFNMMNGCFTSLQIKVRNCNGYFVYYLGPTYSCSLAYCAGNGQPCPYGEYGQPPNCVVSKKEFENKYLGTPTIEVVDDANVAVSLRCKADRLHGLEKWNNVTYKFQWFREGSLTKDQLRSASDDLGTYRPTEKYIDSLLNGGLGLDEYTPGVWISCKVSAKFKNSLKKTWCSPKEVVNPFYAGIKVSPTTLRLNSCKPLDGSQIKIQSTIPVRNDGTVQKLTVTFALPNDGSLKVTQNNNEICKLNLEGTDELTVDIKPICNALQNDISKTRVIVVEFNGGGIFWMRTKNKHSVWVSILETHVERCKTYTDPHYYAMEKMDITRSFDFMGHGDFVLYENKEKNFEVHTRQWACNYRGVTCNCGAVLRDHNDVIEFNCCNKDLMFQNTHPTPLQVKIRNNGCLRPGIYLGKKFNGGNDDYTVIFPTGVKVDIVRNYWGIDINILTNRADSRDKEAGICLVRAGDDINTYGEQQRKTTDSLFETMPTIINDKKADYAPVCSCQTLQDSGQCGQLPFHVPSYLKSKTTPFNLCDRNPIKRDIHYSDELTDEDFELFKTPLLSENQDRFKRALPAPVIPKQNATRYCTKKIADTKIGKICADVGVDVRALVDSCSLDVSLTGDYSFAIGIAAMLTSECGYVAAINASSQKNESSGSGQAEVSIENELTELLCPNDCAFNGDCVNGTCVCYKDYTAEDCSISIYQKPSLSRLQGDGLCDKRVRPCKKVTVMGIGWLNSTNITCHVVEFKVVNSSWRPNQTERSFPGIMIDLLLVECYLPVSPVMQGHFDWNIEGTPAAGLTLSVSNDGIHKSDKSLTLISYDSACMTCNVSTGCSLKSDSCYINQYCFAPNEVHPHDFCYQCLPDVDKNTWTKRRVNHPPNITSQAAFYALYQENLELAFDAVDPEGMPVTITLVDGSSKGAVMQDNVFYWNVTATQTTTFYLKATDACQASSTFNFTVSLVSCQCQNNGTCSPVEPRGTGYYLCNCLPGFKGAKCETNIDECKSYPCIQGQCDDGINNYTCICDAGYDGRNCDHDIDDCAKSPCVHGNCTDRVNRYICNCIQGYTGPQCDTNIDECLSSPCFYGTCVDQVNSYNCQCEGGYTGRDCDIDIDECQSSPCINGNCIDKVNGFNCSCQTGFSGIRCEVNINDCLPVSCGNGTCVDHVNNYSCICNVGFTGRHCEVLVTHCSNDSCYPGVPCTEKHYAISCGSCPSGFQGDGKNCKDIDDCVNHTCANGGSCIDGINNYSCNCLVGFTGDRCEIDVDECINHTCRNGGSCVDGINRYSCNCQQGFTGDHCETDINDCVNHSCSNGGSCVDGINNYSCICLAGFTGDRCMTNIDECVNHTCRNGGSCVDGINNYSCNCQPGFTGDRCEADIDECVNHTCRNGGSCVDGINNYSCNCLVGFIGDHCEINFNDCVNHTCRNGGSCVDGINNYSCNCQPGFTGDRCETDINDCVSQKCSNGGSCVDGINRYSCNCLTGFTGDHCETNINDCVNHTCNNGGSCVDGVNNYSCNCLAGFTGNLCETVISTPHTKSTRQPTTSLPAKTPISIKTTTTTATASTKSVKRSTTAPATSYEISVTSTVQEPATSSSINEVIPTSEQHSKTTTPTPTTGERETKQPVTEEPETEKPETEVTIELSIEMKWNNDLEDKTSDAFKKLSRVFENEIQEQYSQDDDFVSVEILSFRQGSVVVEFKLAFKTKLENEEALAPLKEGIKDGQMGSLKVDPKSLKVKRDSEEPTKPKIAFPVIIGISCGGVFLLAVVTVCVVRYCQRRKVGNRRRVSDLMPAEVSFPRREKYELEEKKEDILRYEEVAISAIGVHYEELGNPNEAVRYEKLGTSGEDARYVEAGPSTDAGQYEDIGISNAAATDEEVDILNKAMQQ